MVPVAALVYKLEGVAVALLLFFLASPTFSLPEDELEIMPLASFRNGEKTSLHMPCVESNMFATKCMCHLKCTDKSCKNAVDLCKKYSKSKGCKYVLTRGVGKQGIATLKRTPTTEEYQKFSLAGYPVTDSELAQSKWSDYSTKINDNKPVHTLLDLMNGANATCERIVESLLSDATAQKPLCPKPSKDLNNPQTAQSWKQQFLQSSISLFSVNYQAPKTLVNSMRTWNNSGLLDMMSEKHIFMNDAWPVELAIAHDFGFDIIQPKNHPDMKRSKKDVITIGTAFYQAVVKSKSEFILFLENDFKMDASLTPEQIKAELIGAAGMLYRGAEIVRLQSRKYQGCGTFKSCDHHGIHLDNPDSMERRRNWFAFYCKGYDGTANYVADCLEEPSFRCFTSWDSNWTLNAVLVRKSTMLNKMYPNQAGNLLSIAEIGKRNYQANDGFERQMSWDLRWMDWKVPICISYNGLFIHEEIETSV